MYRIVQWRNKRKMKIILTIIICNGKFTTIIIKKCVVPRNNWNHYHCSSMDAFCNQVIKICTNIVKYSVLQIFSPTNIHLKDIMKINKGNPKDTQVTNKTKSNIDHANNKSIIYL